MKTTKLTPRLVLLLGATVSSGAATAACEGTCMAVGTSSALRGALEIGVPVMGRADVLVHGFSLALGHDASRLQLTRIEPGALFLEAELVSQTIENESGARGAPHGALFVVLDFQQPIDKLPVDISSTVTLGTFYFDVKTDAPEGPAFLHLGNREYGLLHREVSILFVDAQNFELYPDLVDGAIHVTVAATMDRVLPDHGALAGGTRVVVHGAGLAAAPEGRISFGGVEATIIDVVGDSSLTVLSPAAALPGKVTVRFEGPAGVAELVDAFEYQLAPEVLAVEPAVGPGGESVTLRGRRFTSESRAYVGSLELQDVVILDAETLEGLLGPCALQDGPGPHRVRVENLNGAGTLERGFICARTFLRGDCNRDEELDISDAIFALAYLFSGGLSPTCEDACDLQDDGEVDISDPIWSLSYLFQGGAPPLVPFPTPGLDVTQDLIDCDQ